MQSKTSLLVTLCACASLFLPACTSNSPAVASSAPAATNVPSASQQNAGTPDRAVNTPSNQGAVVVQSPNVYMQRGMEISSITSRMADVLQHNMFYYLLPNAPVDRSTDGAVKIVTMPRIAITSFVDTDTYENAGYLGRALAEFFTNEMSNRAFEVTEYKLTGKLSVTTDGDFMLSRNWRKIARDTRVKYLLGGTMTRNDKGIVLVARIVNMQTRQVIATATDFIPYELLPTCYRTAKKNCSFTGAEDYLNAEKIRDLDYYKKRLESAESRIRVLEAATLPDKERNYANRALTKARVISARGKPLGGVFLTEVPVYYNQAVVAAPASNTTSSSSNLFSSSPEAPLPETRFQKDVVGGATSRGNYDEYLRQRDSGFIDPFSSSSGDPVVYPANTYMHNTLLIRDTADESAYERVKR